MIDRELIRANRRSFESVPQRVEEAAYEASVDRYGIPPHLVPLLDRPIDAADRQGRRYSLLFSDALHQPDAVIAELDRTSSA